MASVVSASGQYDPDVDGRTAAARVLEHPNSVFAAFESGDPVASALPSFGRGGLAMGRLAQDLRHGVRLLVRAPGFAIAALLVLALGIGANAAIFSVVNAVLLEPLPYPDSSRLVRVWHTPPAAGFPGSKTFAV